MTARLRNGSAFWRSPAGVTLVAFLAVAALLLVLEHRVHLLGAWPLLFLLLCAGMHLFMHRGRGGHRSHTDRHHAGHQEGSEDGR